MKIVVIGTGPEGKDVAKGPGKVVTAVGIDGLEETENNPEVHGGKVKLAGGEDPNDGGAHNAETKEHNLNWGRVLSGKTEGSAVGVVELVNRLVERAVVQSAVEPVMPGILNDEENDDLIRHIPPGGERNAVVHAEVSRDRVEEPDLRELNSAVRDEDERSTFPLLLPCGNLGLLW